MFDPAVLPLFTVLTVFHSCMSGTLQHPGHLKYPVSWGLYPGTKGNSVLTYATPGQHWLSHLCPERVCCVSPLGSKWPVSHVCSKYRTPAWEGGARTFPAGAINYYGVADEHWV